MKFNKNVKAIYLLMLVFMVSINTRLQATTPDSKENSKTFIQTDVDVGEIEMYVVKTDMIELSKIILQLDDSFKIYQAKENRKELNAVINKKRDCSIFETKQLYRRSRDGLRKINKS